MVITVPIVKYEKIELTDSQMFEIMLDLCNKKLKFSKDMYITEEGDVKHQVEQHSSHSWFNEEFVRKATEDDYAFYRILKRLKELLK